LVVGAASGVVKAAAALGQLQQLQALRLQLALQLLLGRTAVRILCCQRCVLLW
jgi:hypothetical protein